MWRETSVTNPLVDFFSGYQFKQNYKFRYLVYLKKKRFPSTHKSCNKANLKFVELTVKIIKNCRTVSSIFSVIREGIQNSIKESLIRMGSFELFIVFVARWYSKVSLQFLCSFLGRLSWAAFSVFSRLHVRVSVFVWIVILVRGIRIQRSFRHRTLDTSFFFLGFREFSSLSNINEKIQINKKRIEWRINTKYLLDSSFLSELLYVLFLPWLQGVLFFE